MGFDLIIVNTGMDSIEEQTFNNVWEAIADNPTEAIRLQTRAQLMHDIIAFLKENAWDSVEAAKHCSITQPRLNELSHGHLAKFTIDDLVNIATALGQRISITLEDINASDQSSIGCLLLPK